MGFHELIEPRVRLKRNMMINGEVLLSLQAVIAAYQAIAGIPNVTFTQAQLDAIAGNLKKMIAATRAQADAITDATTAAMLAQLDGARGSWTNEDA
jgi:hypothetical protein